MSTHKLSEENHSPLAEEAPCPIDLECLMDAAGDDPEMLQEIISLYISQTQEHIKNLRAAVKRGATEDVCKLAHKCLGGSLTCGVTAMVPPLRELERIGRGLELSENAECLIDQAEDEFNEVRLFLNPYLA